MTPSVTSAITSNGYVHTRFEVISPNLPPRRVIRGDSSFARDGKDLSILFCRSCLDHVLFTALADTIAKEYDA